MAINIDNGALGIIGITEIRNGSEWRRVIVPGYWDPNGNFVATDLSGETQDIQTLATGLWTSAVIAAYKLASPYEPPPPPSASQIRYQAFQSDSNRQAILAAISTATPAQVATYVNNQVTDLASAKAMLVKVVLLLATVAS